ncbi:RNA polymerase II transcription regulator recruiting protein [Aureococcus anophagefferens]|nr:RNA polymerase II transcription regulator recruiting protein [Aureococcus anophagefferens]
MRIMIKGGVWKNTEDEILKAAVMKYGKNQWARVASLLNRKSAKQCKARWYEWLDPSIKKTEWTRDEEEKLLHLAKLYPCQWRTVAPLVGRTAAQCMERYERLLDDAEREIAGEGGAEGGGSSEEVRRLRPGEIDPNPEKKRELKAAGIYTSRFGGRSNKKYMDYDAEVPFQKLAPAGFYDVSGEKRADGDRKRSRGDADFEAIRLDRFEEQRRDAAEKIAARDDKKKVQKLMKANLPLAVAQLSALNDPSSVLRRSELALPAPQVTDEELEDIARLGADSDGGARAPRRLASGASGADVTPLLGEDQADREAGTGYAGATPLTGGRVETPSALSLRGPRPPRPDAAGLTQQKAPTPPATWRADAEAFDERRLVAAAALIQAEADATMPAAGPDFGAAWEAKFADVVYFPDAGAWGSAADCEDESRLVAAHKAAFEATRATMAKGAARAARIEERVDAALKPIVDECEKLREEIDEAAADLDQAAIEAACYKRLHRLEKVLQQRVRPPAAVDDMDAAAARS